MKRFAYHAIDRSGKAVRGQLEAENQEQALRLLRNRGLYPSVLKEQKLPGRFRQASGELPTMILLLGKLLAGGVPLDHALELLAAEIHDPRLKQALSEVLESVKAGSDLAGAMAESRAFPTLVVEMVRAGESAGQLATVLEQLAAHLTSQEESRQTIKSALLYPALLFFAALVSTGFLLVFLLPRLAELFADFDQNLPQTTVFLMNLGSWLKNYWLLALAVISLVLLGLWNWLSKPKGGRWLSEVLLRLPALGQIFIYTYTARIANTFAILLKGGVPLAQAFPIVRSAVGSSVFAEILSTAEERVREGEKLAEALADNQYFPNLATAMIASGEETGSLAEMLAHLAATYQYRADLGRKTLLSLVEPAIILVMGLLVGFVVVSVLVPIFDLNSYLN
jgi:type II secretory pathway component PulF